MRWATDVEIHAEVKVLDDDGNALCPFTIRWSGQIRPRFSETYAFDVKHLDGARLWIDGRILFDEWKEDPGAPSDPYIALDGGRWHAIRLEIRSLVSKAHPGLAWS